MKLKVYSTKGTSTKEFSLPKEFDTAKNKSLLNQAVRVYEDNSHTGLSVVKTRAEVIRTKKKWYKQKGTGGARHGAKSAPIFVGGGVAHGPKGVKRPLGLPKKMAKKAFVSAVSFVFKNKKAVVVEGLEKVEKTADAVKILKVLRGKLEVSNTSKVLVVLSKPSFSKARFYKNINGCKVVLFDNLNAFELLNSGFVLFDVSVFDTKVKKKDNSPKKGSKK